MIPSPTEPPSATGLAPRSAAREARRAPLKGRSYSKKVRRNRATGVTLLEPSTAFPLKNQTISPPPVWLLFSLPVTQISYFRYFSPPNARCCQFPWTLTLARTFSRSPTSPPPFSYILHPSLARISPSTHFAPSLVPVFPNRSQITSCWQFRR